MTKMYKENNLTKNQQIVLDLIEKSREPVKAYSILSNVKKKGIKAPPQVYRALEKLIEIGKIHKVESKNAFVVCKNTNCEVSNATAFSICQACEKVTEIVNSSDGSLSALLGASPGASTAVSIMVEVLEKSVLFLNDKHNLQKKINDLIYPELSASENDSTFIKDIKKRNNSIFGFHP